MVLINMVTILMMSAKMTTLSNCNGTVLSKELLDIQVTISVDSL